MISSLEAQAIESITSAAQLISIAEPSIVNGLRLAQLQMKLFAEAVRYVRDLGKISAEHADQLVDFASIDVIGAAINEVNVPQRGLN